MHIIYLGMTFLIFVLIIPEALELLRSFSLNFLFQIQRAGKFRYLVSQKGFTLLNKNIWPIFKTKMLIFQSKANLDVKILFGEIIRIYDPKLANAWDLYGTRIPLSILVRDLLGIEI